MKVLTQLHATVSTREESIVHAELAMDFCAKRMASLHDRIDKEMRALGLSPPSGKAPGKKSQPDLPKNA